MTDAESEPIDMETGNIEGGGVSNKGVTAEDEGDLSGWNSAGAVDAPEAVEILLDIDRPRPRILAFRRGETVIAGIPMADMTPRAVSVILRVATVVSTGSWVGAMY